MQVCDVIKCPAGTCVIKARSGRWGSYDRLINRHPGVRGWSRQMVIIGQGVLEPSRSSVVSANLESGTASHGGHYCVCGCDQRGGVVSECAGVDQVDRGGPMHGIKRLRRGVELGCVLSVACEGRLLSPGGRSCRSNNT